MRMLIQRDKTLRDNAVHTFRLLLPRRRCRECRAIKLWGNLVQEANTIDPIVELTAEVVSAYVASNSVPRPELPSLIERIHSTFQGLGKPAAIKLAPPDPAVPVKSSVTADYLICLEDGRKFRSLRRHLMTKYGMTPEEYRAKWNLPRDYPMVAPNYAAVRSNLAKKMRLGHRAAEGGKSEAPTPRARKAKQAK